MEVDILDVRQLCQDDAVQWTAHVAQRLGIRNLCGVRKKEIADEGLHVLQGHYESRCIYVYG